MNDNEMIVRDFIAAWSRLDPEELGAFFHEDGTYHNMPITPVSGRDNIVAFIAKFIARWTTTRWEIRTILTEGNVVVVERVDRTQIGDRSVNLACLGVFEMRNGKILTWRDYFDMETYARAFR